MVLCILCIINLCIYFTGESHEDEGIAHPLPSIYTHKAIEDCTSAEESGVELASKVDRISYTGKIGSEMSHQLWLIRALPRLSQTKQDITRWLSELCTAKTTWLKKRRGH